jgi:hypothetical protein
MTRLFSAVGKLSGLALLSVLAAGTSYAQYGYGPQPGYSEQGRDYAVEHARNAGFQDGVADGERDRATGHSFRPTHDDRYKDAPDHGGREGLRRDDFKSLYREAYLRGYDRGYQQYGGRRY